MTDNVYELGMALPPRQQTVDDVLGRYNSGIEPIESWLTRDIVALIQALDAELQNRAPQDA